MRKVLSVLLILASLFAVLSLTACGNKSGNATVTFMYGGNIAANKRGVYNGGTFSMYGGNIADNSDDGVWNAMGGTFTLHAGKITYNTGWGVNNDGGTFTMYNGEISHNSHNAAENAVKCGVMNDGTFTMNGGKIADNNGDGVMNNNSLDSKFIMNDGEISGNSGDGVYNPSTFTMNGGTVKAPENQTQRNAGYGGLFSVAGTLDVYNGTISGGSVDGRNAPAYGTGTEVNHDCGYGGNIYVNAGTVNIYGGSVKDGFSHSAFLPAGTYVKDDQTLDVADYKGAGGGLGGTRGVSLRANLACAARRLLMR